MLSTLQMQRILLDHFHRRGLMVAFEAVERRPFDDLEFVVDLRKVRACVPRRPGAVKVSMPEIWGDRAMPGHVFLLDSGDNILDTLVVRSCDDMARSIRHFLPLAVLRLAVDDIV